MTAVENLNDFLYTDFGTLTNLDEGVAEFALKKKKMDLVCRQDVSKF